MGNIKLISSKGKKKGKKVRRRTAAKTAFIIILILLLGIATLIISMGFYVRSLDVVLPNVWADGIKLSGMTLEEARQALINEGYERNADGVSATVTFPDGGSFTISGEEAGFSWDANDAATAAYEFGRGGSFFSDELAYIRAYMSRTDLRDLSFARFNETYVREIVDEHTREFNNTLVDTSSDISISSERIVVVKGASVKPADADEVYELTVATLVEAMDKGRQLTVGYEPPDEVRIDEIDLRLLFDRIFVEPVSSRYDPETFSATESSQGCTFDLEAAQTMLNNAGIGTPVVIPILTLAPEVTKDEIESLLFRDVLYETTTYASGTSNRLSNIMLAAAEIDGTQLNPGDVFSFNRIVGERTAARGFREANAYVGGMTVQEIGGGICQVSSTIYNCVLYADLEVVERRPHGYSVSYLPLGNDATVAWGYIDFKFRNSTEYPLRIEATVGNRDGRELTVRLIGTKLDDTYIKVDYVHISTTPYQVVEREDESIAPGTTSVFTDGYTGHTVDTYKHYYDGDDNLIRDVLVGRSIYNVRDRVILIPVADPDNPDGEQPGETPDGEPGEQPGEGPDGEPGEQPGETPDGEPGEPGEPGEQPGETPDGEPGEGPGETPEGEPGEQPGETPAENPEGRSGEEPAGDIQEPGE